MLWLALKPTQARHIVVSFVMTGETWFMLISSAGSRGVSFAPQNVYTRWTTPSVKIMLALRIMRILAAKMLSPSAIHGSVGFGDSPRSPNAGTGSAETCLAVFGTNGWSNDLKWSF